MRLDEMQTTSSPEEKEDDCYAVLLPMTHNWTIEPWLETFLAKGGRSILVSSSAEEYAARTISVERRAVETTDGFRRFVASVKRSAGSPVLVAVDAESGGVRRLEHLLPNLPTAAEAEDLDDVLLKSMFDAHASAAREVGVSMFLGPVVDWITGENAWLHGRMMALTEERVERVALLYQRAAAEAGLLATAKHFPGHPNLSGHPGVNDVMSTISLSEIDRTTSPFKALIEEGVEAVMVGPVTVTALDPEQPAGTSQVVVSLLRKKFEFNGLVVSDDLDLVSTMRGRNLGEVAVASIDAGVQLLLVPGGLASIEVAEALKNAVQEGRLDAAKLKSAADTVRSLTERFATAPV